MVCDEGCSLGQSLGNEHSVERVAMQPLAEFLDGEDVGLIGNKPKFGANDLSRSWKAQLTEHSLDADFPKRRYADENFICCIGDLAART